MIAVRAEDVFDLSLSVDAHQKSMGAGERAVAGVTSGQLGLGDWVTWRARHFGLPFRMTSVISSWERPHRFVDEQWDGPFASWRHEHVFETAEGGTRMLDTVVFTSPWGLLGRLADRLFLADYMRDLIERRNAWLREALAP